MQRSIEFKNAIFAGGGSRCLWQLGFWEGANTAGLGLSETVDYAASTSAGCAMATAALLDRGKQALELFMGLRTILFAKMLTVILSFIAAL